MHVEPFACLRPTTERVTEFAALPYDVFTDDEARAYVESHPTSFLAIDRPETAFEPDHDPYAADVYAHAAQLLADRQADGTLVADDDACFYLLEQATGDHRQRGIMSAIAAADYEDGTLKRHELTLLKKEQDRVNHIEALQAQTGPVFVTYKDDESISALMDEVALTEPLYDFASFDGVHHRAWRICREDLVRTLVEAFAGVPCGYIADGHHRAAAAVRVSKTRGDGSADHFLAVLFPASQLRILPYDRVVSDLGELDEDALVARMEEQGFSLGAAQDEPVDPEEKGTFGIFVGGHWRRAQWKGDGDALDVQTLQEHVLGPLLNIEDPRNDARISFVGGVRAHELEPLTNPGGAAFSLFPTSIEELMSIADADGLMPPKSTWFDPKLLSGLAIRQI